MSSTSESVIQTELNTKDSNAKDLNTTNLNTMHATHATHAAQVEQKKMLTKILKSENKYPTTLEEANLWNYAFWSGQPVPLLDEFIPKQTQITNLTLSDEPVTAPQPYEFQILDLSLDENLEKLTKFLENNYVSLDSKRSKTIYTSSFLRWLLLEPQSINLCLISKGILGGFVHGSVKKLQVYDDQLDSGEVSFLCVHSKLRGKNVATLLISEMKRQLNKLANLQVGFFETTTYLPSPFCAVKTFHRPINYVKLVESGYIEKTKGNVDSAIGYYAIQGKLSDNLVKLTEDLYQDAYECYKTYIEKYCFYEILSFGQFIYKYCSNADIQTYVFTDKTRKPIDILSFYTMKTQKKMNIRACILYLYTSNITTPISLLKNLTIFASENKCDVVTVTNELENEGILVGNKFAESKESKKLYFYNYKCPPLNANQMYKPGFSI